MSYTHELTYMTPFVLGSLLHPSRLSTVAKLNILQLLKFLLLTFESTTLITRHIERERGGYNGPGGRQSM